jgi:hypothetical protein
MSPTDFDDTLRKFMRARPFMPFVVELLDGRQLVFTEPTVAFDNGGAISLSKSRLDIFECEDVRAIRPAAQGATA